MQVNVGQNIQAPPVPREDVEKFPVKQLMYCPLEAQAIFEAVARAGADGAGSIVTTHGYANPFDFPSGQGYSNPVDLPGGQDIRVVGVAVILPMSVFLRLTKKEGS